MPTLPGALRGAESDFYFTILACILQIPLALSSCPTKVALESTPKILNYTSISNFHWISWTEQPELKIITLCNQILFQDAEKKDIVRLEVISSYMKPRMFKNNLCLDRASVYDGISLYDKKLGEFCGNEVPVFESSGSSLLLIIEKYDNRFTEPKNIGFQLNYSRIDRNLRVFVRQSSLGVITIAFITVSAVFVFCTLIIFIYKCIYAHTVRHTRTVSLDNFSSPGESLALPFHRQNQPLHNNTPDIVTNANLISRPGSAKGPQRSAQGPQRSAQGPQRSAQGPQRSAAVGDVCIEAGPPPSYEDAVLGNMQWAS